MVRDSAVVTMESHRKPPCSLEWYDRSPRTTSPSPNGGGGIKCTLILCWISNGHIFAIGHPIHFTLRSR